MQDSSLYRNETAVIKRSSQIGRRGNGVVIMNHGSKNKVSPTENRCSREVYAGEKASLYTHAMAQAVLRYAPGARRGKTERLSPRG